MLYAGYAKGLLIGVATLVLFGCAPPLKVDISGSEYKPTASVTKQPPQITSHTIINRAPPPDGDNGVLGPTQIPINPERPLSDTVESDLKLLFAQTVTINQNADQSIIITLRRAEAFWKKSKAENLPFVGLFMAARERTFVMNIALTASLMEDGEEVISYPAEREITIEGSATTRKDIAKNYERLVAEYRETILPQLVDNFILQIPNEDSI